MIERQHGHFKIICHVFSSDALGAMTKVADQLQTNGAEESKACMQFSAAFFRGVSLLPGLCIVY